ncbi:hypothetical protein GY45DRAFT_387469 [Cubamyces sp. BRFM 1775]|nr:hypothetical protein GY45DRAFT_387469 [Cubamyces sp. BRFM 1775]
MTHHYKPSPARSEPASTPTSRGLPSGYRIVGVQRAHRATSVRPTLDTPTTIPMHRDTPRRPAPPAAGLGLGLPSTLTTHVHPRPERPQLRRTPAGHGLGLPTNPAHVRYIRRRVAGSHPRPLDAQIANPRAPGHPRRCTVILLLRLGARNDDEVYSEDEEDEIDYDDPPPVYSRHPPGLEPESPSSQPSGESPASQPAPSEPAPPPYERHIPVRRVQGSALRAPGDITQPGAPLSPSVSHIGTHRHFPGLDHSAGGVADEGWLPWMGLPTLEQMWEMLPTMVPNAPRFPFIERFAYDPLYQL